MGITLKTIKIAFTIDAGKLERNLSALGKSVDVASKKVEEANKGIAESNKTIAATNEAMAKSTETVTQAAAKNAAQTETSNKVLRVLRGTLVLLKGSIEAALAGLHGLTLGMAGAATLAIKFHRQIGIVTARAHDVGKAVGLAGRAALKFGLDLFTLNLGVFKLLQNIGVAVGERGFPRLGIALIAASGHVALFTNKLSGMIMQTGIVLSEMKLIKPVVTKAATGLKAGKVAAAGFAASLVRTAEEMPRVNSAWQKLFKVLAPVALRFRKVGIAVVPLLSKLLSFSAILPGLGVAVTYFAAKALWKLAKGFLTAANNATKFAGDVAGEADALAKTSLKLGLNVEQLQKYQYAASLAGVKTEGFNTGLQRFLRRTAEARQGTGVLKKEFDRLGIALVDSQGYVRDGADVFEEYLEAISKTRDKQEQLRLAYAAFDTEGVMMVNLAKAGAEAFAKQREQAERLGIVLPAAMLRNYERINDALETNNKRVEVARQKNNLWLAEMGLKWDNFKTSIELTKQSLFGFLRTMETLTMSELSQELEKVNLDISATKAALTDFKNIPVLGGVLEAQLGYLIEQQEKYQRLLDQARGDDAPATARRDELITRQIEERIAAQERELEQQRRLTEAARLGEEARQRVANQIAAENAARQLGLQATDKEREAIKQLTLARLEQEEQGQRLLALNRDMVAGEQLRVDALGRLSGSIEQNAAATARAVETLVLATGTTVKMRRDFDRLKSQLEESVAALAKVKAELAAGAGETEESKKKYRELGKEADRLSREIEKTAQALGKMKEKLEDQQVAAMNAKVGITGMGQAYSNAAKGMVEYSDALDASNQKLSEVERGADRAAASIAGMARETQNLGSVISGDVSDPANIQRALNRLNAQLLQLSRGPVDIYGSRNINMRNIRSQITALEADLETANTQFRQEAIRAIVQSASSLSGDAFQEEVARQIKTQEQLGILPSVSSTRPGFRSMSGGWK